MSNEELEALRERIAALEGDKRRPPPGPVSLGDYFKAAERAGFLPRTVRVANPTPDRVEFVVYSGPVSRCASNGDLELLGPAGEIVKAPVWNGHVRLVIEAHAELDVPTTLAAALVQVRDGVIVGGLAPQLRIAGHPVLPFAKGLEPGPDVHGVEEQKWI